MNEFDQRQGRVLGASVGRQALNQQKQSADHYNPQTAGTAESGLASGRIEKDMPDMRRALSQVYDALQLMEEVAIRLQDHLGSVGLVTASTCNSGDPEQPMPYSAGLPNEMFGIAVRMYKVQADLRDLRANLVI